MNRKTGHGLKCKICDQPAEWMEGAERNGELVPPGYTFYPCGHNWDPDLPLWAQRHMRSDLLLGVAIAAAGIYVLILWCTVLWGMLFG